MLVATQSRGYSQTAEDRFQTNSPKSFASTIGADVWHVASSPFRMSTKRTLQFVSFTALNIGLMYGFDGEADEEFAIEEPTAYLKPAEAMADFGDLYDRIGSGRILAGLSTAMVAGGLIFKDKKLLETTRLLIESSAITGIITYASKGLFCRARPYTGKGARDFKFFTFSGKVRFRALPSGHASSAFAMMTVIAKQYDQWWIRIPAYTLAVSVALQRMDDRQHWASDVLVGGAIGYLVSSSLVNRYKNKPQGTSVQPYASKNGLGLSLNF
ncbi:MAG: phosphatase PAP2 family protein [bacterium]